jgi:hypothetical protein
MAMSLAQGKRVTLSKVDAFADGVAVKSVSPAKILSPPPPPALMLATRSACIKSYD